MSLVTTKRVFGSFRPGQTRTGLRSHRSWLESWNFGYRIWRYYTIRVATSFRNKIPWLFTDFSLTKFSFSLIKILRFYDLFVFSVKNYNSKKAYQLVKDLTTEKQGKSTTIQDKSGKCLTEENEILNRWTEYCLDLYYYETDGDPIVLDCPQIPDEEHHPILWEAVEAAFKALKMGKSAGVWITYQQNESKQEEKPWLTSWPQSTIRFGRQENGRPHGLNP